jgi:uncharacterized membrane protein
MEKEFLTILIASSPFAELRGAIPTAVLIWGFPISKAFILSIIGNFLPVIPLLLFWNFLAEKLSDRFYYFNRLFAWLSDRTIKHHSYRFDKWESLALLLFVAIPFPLTGAWSGTLAAFIFGIPIKRASIMILIGILISGTIVSLFIKTGSELLSAI